MRTKQRSPMDSKKILGKGKKVDTKVMTGLPSQRSPIDDDDFESPVRCAEAASGRRTRSQTPIVITSGSMDLKSPSAKRALKLSPQKQRGPKSVQVGKRIVKGPSSKEDVNSVAVDADCRRPVKSKKRKASVDDASSSRATGNNKRQNVRQPKVMKAKAVVQVGAFYLAPKDHFHTRVSSHTNTDIVSNLKKYLTPTQVEMFRKCCFGYFLDLPPFVIQNQLIHCLLLREVAPGQDKELWVKLNGTTLRFGIAEFALITGLKMSKDETTVYERLETNRLLDEYFSGVDSVSRKDLLDRFNEKGWKSDEDALKMAVMVFIHTFLFSDADNHSITKKDFDLVESGVYERYDWGKQVFDDMLRTMRDKQRGNLQMYRLGGLPLAFQTWFYECCSSFDKKLAVRVQNKVPRILNWKSSANPKYVDIVDGSIISIDLLHYRNMSPTSEEKSKLNFDQLFEDFNPPPGDVPASNVADGIFSSPACPSVSDNPLADEVKQLRVELRQLTNQVVILNKFVVDSFAKVFTIIESKSNDLKAGEVPVSEQPGNVAHENMDGQGGDEDFDCSFSAWKTAATTQVDNMQSNVNQTDGVEHMDSDVKQTDGVDNMESDVKQADGVASAFPDDVDNLDNFSDDFDEEFPGANDSQLVIYKPIPPLPVHEVEEPAHEVEEPAQEEANAIKEQNVTPEQVGRQKKPGKFAKSPYTPAFGSAIGDTSGSTRKKIFSMKHPFMVAANLYNPLSDLAQRFFEFVDEGVDSSQRAKQLYPDDINNLEKPFVFGSCVVDKKDWFHHLAYSGQLLSDLHIDTIFYYLRKKGKYGPNVAVSFTTTDWTFNNKITSLFTTFERKHRDFCVIPDEHEVAEYILGYYCDANSPWHTVDYVLLPIYVKRGVGHWVLGVLSFKDRRIDVYDSNRGALNDAAVLNAMLAYAMLIPHFLNTTGFYGKRTDIDWTSGAYMDKSLSDPFDVNLMNDLPHQMTNDCGAYVAGFAEYFIEGRKIEKDAFDIEDIRGRFACLLWDYGLKKQDSDAVSDDEVTGRVFKRKRGRPKK